MAEGGAGNRSFHEVKNFLAGMESSTARAGDPCER